MSVEITQTTLRLPTKVYEAYKQAAESKCSSVNAFMVDRLIAGIRNWKDPFSGMRFIKQEALETEEAAYEGIRCFHGSHGSSGVPARECRMLDQHLKQGAVMHEETLDPLTSLPS